MESSNVRPDMLIGVKRAASSGLQGAMVVELLEKMGVFSALIPLSLAALLGALVGFERLLHTQTTGARTHMLVSMGATAFVLAAREAFGGNNDSLTRIVQGVASGIGFIGAGAILKLSQPAEIRGLTTASTVWLSSSVGIACGLEVYRVAIWSTILALIVLAVLRPFERRIEDQSHQRSERAYEARFQYDVEQPE